MEKRGSGITRRRLFRAASGLAVGGVAGLGRKGNASSTGSLSPGGTEKSRVVLVRSPAAGRAPADVAPDLLHDMLNEAMTALFQASTPAEAWGQLFGTEDIVGIKTNVWNNLRTPESLEEAIRAELIGVGVSGSNIAVDDRGVRTS